MRSLDVTRLSAGVALVFAAASCSNRTTIVYLDGGVRTETTLETCVDQARNGTEADIDCGGSGCRPCESGKQCALASDCASAVCSGGLCVDPSCRDTTKNGAETDTDCGGEACAPCTENQGCFGANDCASRVCTNKTCAAPTCTDGVQNGAESDVDCGPGCGVCSLGKKCATGADCTNGTCRFGVCQEAGCTDAVKNGGETDIDCGGTGCPACAASKACVAATDCRDGVCASGTCSAPSCADTTHNGTETDVDCGGSCGPCADAKKCATANDCAAGVCLNSRCSAPACGDGVKNGAETAPDCGGGTCAVCPAGKACLVAGDCADGVCTNGLCVAATCSDGLKNGLERQADCGGTCAGCTAGAPCALATDCASGVCTNAVCQAPSCGDLLENGSETDVDCGGSTCPKCATSLHCSGATDCLSGVCTSGTCNPVVVAPTPVSSVNLTTAGATAFLYSGPNPVQTGVDAGTIEARRASAVRGRVLSRANAPVSDVVVTILNHPEFGQTATRVDGFFDLAVNGGGPLTVNYAKPGALPLQRNINPLWGQYVVLEDVVLTTLDSKVTTVDLPSLTVPVVAQGTVVTDDDGTRTATMLFMPGTQASMKVGASTTPLTQLHVRATEYTVGPNGPKAMPGALPNSSRYTYAVELSVDEAIAAGASSVTFTQPVPFYVDNFLGLPVGALMPVGFYDKANARWQAEPNGRVIQILSVTSNAADLDVDGTGGVAGAGALAALGITVAERQKLATTFPVGATFWRASMTHFTGFDLNLGGGPPPGADEPPDPDEPGEDDDQPPCETEGSIIGCDNQSLGEAFPIQGTPYMLRYDSGHAAGRTKEFSFDIPVSGPTVPPGTKRIEVEVRVAGRAFKQVFPPLPNQRYQFTWDGLDAFGRRLPGKQRADGLVSNVYAVSYHAARADLIASFASVSGVLLATDRTRGEIMLQQSFTRALGVPATPDLGGWLIDVQHTYSLGDGTLYLGDGSQQKTESLGETITTIAGTGDVGYNGDNIPATEAKLSNPHIALPLRDGSMVIVDYQNHRIRKVLPNGLITTIAGTGTPGHSGDEGPAVNALITSPHTLAIGPDDSVYFSEPFKHTVRRITPDGIIHAYAGNGTEGYTGDNGPATQATMSYPYFFDMGPDGTMYIGDNHNHRIRKVSPDGVMTTVVGTGNTTNNGQGQVGTAHNTYYPAGIAVGHDGTLYFGDYLCQFRKLGADGIVKLVAGTGACAVGGDYGPALAASVTPVHGFGVGPDGAIYFGEYDSGNVIRKITPNGLMVPIAGTLGTGAFSGDNGPARRAQINGPNSVKVFPDGSLVFADLYNSRVRRIAPPLPSLAANQFIFPSNDGEQLFVFDAAGRHLQTRDAMKGVTAHTFTYDAAGRLATIADRVGRVTTIQRNSAGQATGILAPGGQLTRLTMDSSNQLKTITDAANQTIELTMTPSGLLTHLTERNGEEHSFTYDGAGLLIHDTSPGGVTTTLVKSGDAVSSTSTRGRTKIHRTEVLPGGDLKRTAVTATGSVFTTEAFKDGRLRHTDEDGTVETSTVGPDPRFGMQSPVLSTVSKVTPSGLTSTTSFSRAATLATASDPLSLTQLVETVTTNGRTATRTYTVGTKTDVVVSPAGQTRTSIYDAHGLLAQVQESAGLTPVIFTRNAAGHILSARQGTRELELTYGANGLLSTLTTPTQRTTTLTYDALDRLLTSTSPGNHTVSIGYSPVGDPSSITTPAGHVHTVAYVNHRITKYVTPSGATTEWAYDTDGDLQSLKLNSGRALTLVTDSGGRLRTVTSPEFVSTRSYAGQTDRVESFTRTPTGGAPQQLSLVYDGRLVTKRTFAGPATGTFVITYDANFWPKSVQLDASPATSLGTDADGKQLSHGPYTFTRAGPAGALSAIAETAGTLTATTTFDTFGRESTRTHKTGTTPFYAVSLTYDDDGRVGTKTETVAGTQHVYEYTYDADGRLTIVKRDTTAFSTFAYDADGNRTSAQVAPQAAVAATFNSQDQQLTNGSTAYTFDGDGFLSTRGADTFSYAADGTLVSATVGGVTVTYGYDGLARRVSRKQGTATTQYLYATDARRVTHSRSSTGVVSEYFYDDLGRLFAVVRGGVRYSVGSDHVGTPRVVVDSAGTVLMSVDYDAFGNVLSGDPASFELPVGFGGGLPDLTTGLVRLGMRDYEPKTGRFTARDPMLFGGKQSNLYSYADGNPIDAIDREGTTVGVAVGIGVRIIGGRVAAEAIGTAAVEYGIPGMVGACILAGVCTFDLDPPSDAHDKDGAKAPGKPGAEEGFEDPKGGEQWVPNPNGKGFGWKAKDGQVWCPTGHGRGAHGGPHWDVQNPKTGGHRDVYPGGKTRHGK